MGRISPASRNTSNKVPNAPRKTGSLPRSPIAGCRLFATPVSSKKAPGAPRKMGFAPRSPIAGRRLNFATSPRLTPRQLKATIPPPDAPSRERGEQPPLEGAQRNLGPAFAEAARPPLTRPELVRMGRIIDRTVLANDYAYFLFCHGRGRSPRSRHDMKILKAIYDMVLRNGL
jgi:hypothetical protein